MIRSLRWPDLFLAAYVALIAVLLFATPAHSVTRCRGTNGRFIKCPPPPAPTPAPAPAPAPPPPAVTWIHCADQPDICHIVGTAHVRYGIGTSWAPTRSITGSIGCDNVTWGGDPAVGFFPKECQTDGQVAAPAPPPPAPTPAPTPTPAPAPTPAPVPSGSWVAAPLTVGGYACSRVQAADPRSGPCGSGIVYRLTGSMMSADAVPVPQFAAVFFQDASGNFPTGDAYAVNVVGYWQASDLIGIAPGP